MKKGLLLFTFLSFLITTVSSAQTLVMPGEGSLRDAIETAADGDVLTLIGGAEYTESETSFGTITQKLTITVDGGDYNLKPILKFSVNDDSERTFFRLEEGADFTIMGVEADGTFDGVTAANHFIQVGVEEGAISVATINRIAVDYCYVHNLVGNVIDAGNTDIKSLVIIDTTYVHNSVMHDIGTSVYFKYAGENWLSIRNCTIYRTSSYGIRVAGPQESGMWDNQPKTLIDHITIYDIRDRETIQVEKGPNLQPWTITNSIFVKQAIKDRNTLNLKDLPDQESVISNICYWDVGKTDWKNNVVFDTLRMDPGFADPENGDFTLPSGSQLYTFGTDGMAIGDPRWAPEQGVVSVEQNESRVPEEFGQAQNYPNPFNPSTTISFDIVQSGEVSLKIYDVLGSEVATIVNTQLAPGRYNYKFDAGNLPSGIYLYKLHSGNSVMTRKMVLTK